MIILLAISFYFVVQVKSKNVTAGTFVHIYDPSIGEKEKWYINDHCFIQNDKTKTWHLYGITHQEPADPLHEHNFAHATAKTVQQQPYSKQNFILTAQPPEHVLWAPHTVFHDGKYYMYYCGGGNTDETYQIMLAVSENLWNFTRYSENPLFIEGFDTRDPMVLKVGDKWVMYYCSTTEKTGGNHIVGYRTSTDLMTWSKEREGIAYKDSEVGTYGGPTESPFVVEHNGYYYLFICCRPTYKGTEVFKSSNPFQWTFDQKIGQIDSHAAEIVVDDNGKYWISAAGWGQGGVYIAPLYWDDE